MSEDTPLVRDAIASLIKDWVFGVAVFVAICVIVGLLTGCTIHDGYVVARPAIAVSGEYYSPGYGGVSIAVATPPVYPGYGYYGYDPYSYPGYRRYYPPRVVYRRPYYPLPVYRTRVTHHHHHPAYRERGIVPDHRYRRPVSPPTYRRQVVGTAQEQRTVPPRRRPLRARRF